MKIATVTTLLFATLALASPAPAPQPDAKAAQVIETREQFRKALAARDADAAHNTYIAARAPKAKKPKGGSGNNTNDTSAAVIITPSRALQLGALGLGVMEVVRLW
ncbi:Nn.00g106720.m01.CDS01 [Neocucurbitaria sp. VM-36]